jgi:NAD(P)-dependent dehydrogenase (short-subunit alcohol dehydrogenase family)
MAADISDEASCAKLAAFARDKAGCVDVLINCAGFFPTTVIRRDVACRLEQGQAASISLASSSW